MSLNNRHRLRQEFSWAQEIENTMRSIQFVEVLFND
jgi:hypothetical protein